MWPTLDRTRRRWLRAGGLPDAPDADPVGADPVGAHDLPAADLPDPPEASDDVLLTLGRADLDRLGEALRDLLGPDTHRPDTPARLEAALAAALASLGSSGHPSVSRRPAGLSTPEAWQVRLTDVEPPVSEEIRGAIRTGAFAG